MKKNDLSKLLAEHAQDIASTSPQPRESWETWNLNQPSSSSISDKSLWCGIRLSLILVLSFSLNFWQFLNLLSRFLSLCSQVCQTWASLSALPSCLISTSALSGPGSQTVSLLVPATQISVSYKHGMLIWGKLWDYRKLHSCSLYTEEMFMNYKFSPGLYFFALTMPVSTTYFIPVMVMEVSAMLVEMITLR